MKTAKLGIVLLALALIALAVTSPPDAGAQTYFIQSQGGVPMPYDPYDGAEPIITLDATRHIYRVQDNTNDYEMLTTARELDAMSTSSTMSADSIDPSGTNDSGGGTYTNYGNFQPLVFGSNDLWIEILGVDMTNFWAYLRLHGTVSDEHYQLLSTNLLSSDGQNWTLGQYVSGAASTNVTDFSTFNIGTNSQLFFRAHHANPVLAISGIQNAIDPNPATGDPGQAGYFRLRSYYAVSNDLTVNYTITGTAQNGVDYSNLTGVATIPASDNFTNIYVVPTGNNRMQGDKTVTLGILPANDYLVDTNSSSASILIGDSFTLVGVYQYHPIAYRTNGPPGIPAQAATIQFSRIDQQNEYPQMTVNYAISGTASNGVDYTLLSGSLVFSNGQTNVFLDVNPLPESTLKGTQTVIVTLFPTNGYFVDTNHATQTVQIIDTTTTVSIHWKQDAIETNSTGVGQRGIFEVDRSDTRSNYPPMTVNYQISGTASNGVDYQTLSGTISFASAAHSTNIYVITIEEDLLEPDETVILTLIPNGNAYYVDTNNASTNLTIHTTAGFLTVADSFSGVNGIDYYAPSNSLIVSYNYNQSGQPFNFARIYTNIVISGGAPVTNVVVTNWSSIGGLGDEIYFTTARTPAGALTNSGGFTNGDLFFGSNTNIGFLSANGTISNLNWCRLTNSTLTNTLPIRGGICMDETGSFSNQIIVVTSSGDGDFLPESVWRIDSKAHPTLLAQIDTAHLEGVTTLTNDVQQWGPWAGTIITGDELNFSPITGQPENNIFTISTNGTVTTYATTNLFPAGIFPEDFKVIPTNSTLYVTAFNRDSVMELPAPYFRNHVGDLLITQAGEKTAAALLIVHWNAQGTNFVVTPIPLPAGITRLEGTTFAPIQFPGH